MRHFPQLITALATCFAVSVWAAPDSKHEHPTRQAGKTARHDMGPLADLGKMRAELKLTAEQEAKWTEAEAAARAAQEQRRAQHERMRTIMASEREKEVLDLAKLDREMRAAQEEARAQHEASRNKWLAAYESLSLDQKRMVSERIKARMAKKAARAEQMQARRAEMKARMQARHPQHDAASHAGTAKQP